MWIEKLKAKIHRATVTDANLDYVGSITIDPLLMSASGIEEHEKVQVVNINNGERFETYTILGEEGSGQICLNGACARLAQINDKVIIIAYCYLTPEESKAYTPSAVFVDDTNAITSIEPSTA